MWIYTGIFCFSRSPETTILYRDRRKTRYLKLLNAVRMPSRGFIEYNTYVICKHREKNFGPTFQVQLLASWLLLGLMPVFIQGDWPLVRHTIGPTHHWSDTPLVRHTIGPTHHWSDTPLVRHTIGPTHHWSDTQLVRHTIGPTHHWSDTPLVRHTIGPTHQWSDTPLDRHTIGPTNLRRP